MKTSVIIAGLLLLASAALAQTEDRVTMCGGEKNSAEERIAACTQLIDAEGTDQKTRAQVFYWCGDILADQEDYTAAVTDFNQSIELDPTNEKAFQKRLVSHYHLELFELALKDSTHLVDQFPAKSWNYYYHGKVLDRIKEDQKALEAYTK